MKSAIILTSELAYPIATLLKENLPESTIYTKSILPDTKHIDSISKAVESLFNEVQTLVFIGAMGICVRSIAPFIKDKHTDPAVICIDSTGKNVISVLSGHVGGANNQTTEIAHLLGAEAIITTQSDNTNLWALDTLGEKYDWVTKTNRPSLNEVIIAFVNNKKTALILESKDEGTAYLERTKPDHVDVYYSADLMDYQEYAAIIAVTPHYYEFKQPTLYFHPQILHLGVGCRKECDPQGIGSYIKRELISHALAPESIATIATIELKKDESLILELKEEFVGSHIKIFSEDDLKDIEVPNPSQKVLEVTNVNGVSESAAIRSAELGPLLLEKQKGGLTKGNEFTFAVAQSIDSIRQGHIEIVGAGPGDPDLVSVRGRYFLEKADLILYAGSLVPKELTYCAKSFATVRSSAALNLEEQFSIMKEFYDKGLLVVRLHTGDPCIYGAIQEQMAFFDEYNMSYHITPGISSFQAAAAELRSQFTIPEKVQTIILTRGEGRTPMPEKEKLSLLARSQSTMCIFLSASIAEQVQNELLEHYPPSTPVAACYKLTWKDQKIYRGELKDLAQIITDNQLTLTTMIVVGEAIDNRTGLSKLYSDQFKHLFRK